MVYSARAGLTSLRPPEPPGGGEPMALSSTHEQIVRRIERDRTVSTATTSPPLFGQTAVTHPKQRFAK